MLEYNYRIILFKNKEKKKIIIQKKKRLLFFLLLLYHDKSQEAGQNKIKMKEKKRNGEMVRKEKKGKYF